MITTLVFWSVAQILVDFTVAVHILRTLWSLALKGQQHIQRVAVASVFSFCPQGHKPTFSATSSIEMHGV